MGCIFWPQNNIPITSKEYKVTALNISLNVGEQSMRKRQKFSNWAGKCKDMSRLVNQISFLKDAKQNEQKVQIIQKQSSPQCANTCLINALSKLQKLFSQYARNTKKCTSQNAQFISPDLNQGPINKQDRSYWFLKYNSGIWLISHSFATLCWF